MAKYNVLRNVANTFLVAVLREPGRSPGVLRSRWWTFDYMSACCVLSGNAMRGYGPALCMWVVKALLNPSIGGGSLECYVRL